MSQLKTSHNLINVDVALEDGGVVEKGGRVVDLEIVVLEVLLGASQTQFGAETCRRRHHCTITARTIVVVRSTNEFSCSLSGTDNRFAENSTGSKVDFRIDRISVKYAS